MVSASDLSCMKLAQELLARGLLQADDLWPMPSAAAWQIAREHLADLSLPDATIFVILSGIPPLDATGFYPRSLSGMTPTQKAHALAETVLVLTMMALIVSQQSA